MGFASRLIWSFWRYFSKTASSGQKKIRQLFYVTFLAAWFHNFFKIGENINSFQIFCQIIMVRPLNNNVPEGRSVAYKQFSNMTVSNWLVTLYPQNSKFNSCKNFCVEIHCAIYKQNTKKQRKVAWKILSKYMYIRGRLLTFFFANQTTSQS